MPEFDVLAFGETMGMLVAEEPGDLAEVTHFGKRIAGADSNVVIGLTRLGLRVAWLSRVGNDSLGRFIRLTLEREGVDCSRVTIDPHHPTGFQFKSREVDGRDPTVEYFRRGSAASYLSIEEDFDEQLLNVRHLHATGIPPALSDSLRELSQHLMHSARQAGRSVSFDPNLRPSLWSSEAAMCKTINHLASLADWVLPGLAEGRLLTGYETPEDIAAFYLDKGASAVAIKLGPEGTYFRTPNNSGHVPGYPVETVVDTVGAGDGFATGFISALLEGLDIPAAIARGNWIGARAVQVIGDMEGLPYRNELP
ncbi:dehydrogluconokinase [Pseudomonas duriflava]|uniref:Dehydrogluconokinase n=1 Tax=Pseudomonas duriflava TaxID=459528 RepID=A0A562QFK3_9PSED|nr:sugar kinase [Pseudomonas duriflava]TWI55524.1 dehydrogluconokinase [Pseudomonas duriflava]